MHQQDPQLSSDLQMDEKGNVCVVSFDGDTGTDILTPAVDILKALYEIAVKTCHTSPRTLREVEDTLKKYPKK